MESCGPCALLSFPKKVFHGVSKAAHYRSLKIIPKSHIFTSFANKQLHQSSGSFYFSWLLTTQNVAHGPEALASPESTPGSTPGAIASKAAF